MSSAHDHSDLLLSNQLCFRLYTASRLIIKSYTPLLTRLGLTYPQYLVMMVLWERGVMSVGEIARQLMLQTNTVTPLLKRMETEGLVKREKAAGDQRQTIVSLTARGREMESEAADIPSTQVGRFLCNGADEETIPGMNIRLDSLIIILRAMTGEDDGSPDREDLE